MLGSLFSLFILSPSDLFAALLIGASSDRLGRKPALIFATLGLCFQSLAYLLIVNYQLPLQVFLAGDIIAGVSGGIAIILATGAAYVADITPEKSRTVRIIIVEASFFLGSAVGQVSLGFTVQLALGTSPKRYNTSLWIALGCTVAAVVYAMIPRILAETVDRRANRHTIGLASLLRAILNLIMVTKNI